MQLRNTIHVPVLNDKNLYVFVIGVLDRRRDADDVVDWPPFGRFQGKSEQKRFQTKIPMAMRSTLTAALDH